MLFTGPVTIINLGPTAEEIAAAVTAALTPLEQKMSDATDFLAAEGDKIDVLTAGIADIAADVQVLLDKAASAGVFTADEQAAAAAVTEKLDALHAAVSGLNDEVGDQDGSDTPPAPAE